MPVDPRSNSAYYSINRANAPWVQGVFARVQNYRLAMLLLLSCLTARAQTPTATLTGRVTDSSGASLPGAVIQVRNLNTNEARIGESSLEGDYTFAGLMPGTYEVTFESRGFKRARESALELQIDQAARLDIALQPGDIIESVEVTAELPVLNSENAVKGDVITSQEIVEMPLDGRDFADLAFLVPGVSRRAQGGSGSAFAINGARGDNTNFVIDGFNDRNIRGAGVQVRPPIDAMQEFKMQVSNYPAEYGQLAGGVMNMVLKTGGNAFHGAVFEFLRNDRLDARKFFDESKSKLRRNQFGGTLYGPLVIPRLYNGRNRTFFLLAGESYRQVLGATRLGRVPTALEREGDFSRTVDVSGQALYLRDPLTPGACTAEDRTACFPENRLPASRLHPVAAKLIPYYPLENRPSAVNNYLVNANDSDRWDNFAVKLDQRFGNDNLSFRFLQRRNDLSNPFEGSDLGTFGNLVSQAQTLTGFTFTKLIGASLINEVRTGFSRTAHAGAPVHTGQDIASQLGILGTTTDPRFTGFPRFTVRDLVALGNQADSPLLYHVNNYEIGDTFTWVRSRHLVKFGGSVLRSQFFQPGTNNLRGTFNFLGRWTNVPFGDFMLGLLNNATRRVGVSDSYLFSTAAGFFLQDDIKLTHRVTLNLGLRYELSSSLHEKYGRLANFVPELGKIVIARGDAVPDLEQRIAAARLTDRVTFAGDVGLPETLVYMPRKSFAPRLGLAWRPAGNRTVIRSGYGIFYGASLANPVRGDLAQTFPFSVNETYNRNSNNPGLVTLSNPFPPNRVTLEGVTNSDGYQLRAPAQYLQAWNFSFQRELGRGTAIEISYVGSKGTHLARRYNINQPLRVPELRPPGSGFPRPFSGINDISYYSFGSNSIYNAGIASLQRRYRNGIFFRVNYIYSKSIDDASQVTGDSAGGYGGAQDARNLKLERARSDWDNGHATTMNFSYQLPRRRPSWLRGWQVAGTGRMYTGQPFTPRVSNVQLDQGEANRPDRIAKGRLDQRGPERWFDLSAFPVVPLNSFRMGNSGRNILDGPGFVSLNTSLLKRFYITERTFLQFRAEAYNVLNHTNFRLPRNYVNAPNAATITDADPARLIQFGLKYYF